MRLSCGGSGRVLMDADGPAGRGWRWHGNPEAVVAVASVSWSPCLVFRRPLCFAVTAYTPLSGRLPALHGRTWSHALVSPSLKWGFFSPPCHVCCKGRDELIRIFRFGGKDQVRIAAKLSESMCPSAPPFGELWAGFCSRGPATS